MTRSQKLALFIAHHSFVSCFEPTKVEEALQDPDWINAMHEELNNFTRNEVWTLEERPQSARVIGTKWVFRNKQDDQGVVVRNKARLVANGFSQVEGLDFGETFAPIDQRIMREGIFISQEKYTNDLLKRFKIDECKPIKTPMPSNGHLRPR